jgi:hypothetical protein
MTKVNVNLAQELRGAKSLWKHLPTRAIKELEEILRTHFLSILSGDVQLIDGRWYITHVALIRLAERRHCRGIQTHIVLKSCDPTKSRWVFRATVFKSAKCKGFTGYGDADPSNVSPFLHGAEMRVAETRAVNRALRKAYGIGLCSVEEIGSVGQSASQHPLRKLPPESTNGNGNKGYGVNGNGSRVRDRLCQIIRQHKLDAELVKAYAVDFCGTKTLREASREQVENFVAHLADWAVKDRNALLCKLNSFVSAKRGAA